MQYFEYLQRCSLVISNFDRHGSHEDHTIFEICPGDVYDVFFFLRAGRTEVFFGLLDGVLTIVFSAYCIIAGIQEIKKKQIIDARYFEVFGLFFEFLIFITVFFLAILLLNQPIDLWRIGLLTMSQFGLLVLIIVDFKKISDKIRNISTLGTLFVASDNVSN